jgi:hypothetical protein
VAGKFFEKIQSFIRRYGIHDGVVVVKIHKGEPAYFTVTLECRPHAKKTTRLYGNTKTSVGILYAFEERMSRLLKYCAIRFGGVEVEIAKDRVAEAKFYTLIRMNELETLSNFFCPMTREEPMHRICSKVGDGCCRVRAEMRAARVAGRKRSGAGRARIQRCQ